MSDSLPIVVGSDEAETARLAVARIEDELRRILDTGRKARIAFSGGTTPWLMIRELAARPLPWEEIQIFQVDERCVSADDPRRNGERLRRLLPRTARIHLVPTTPVGDPEALARAYEVILREELRGDPRLDLVHLGLGADGHTASLVPGDPILGVEDRWVATTEKPYGGVRRVSLTYPLLREARLLLWLVTGESKREILRRFLAGDTALPASRLPRDRALVYADRSASGDSPGR